MSHIVNTAFNGIYEHKKVTSRPRFFFQYWKGRDLCTGNMPPGGFLGLPNSLPPSLPQVCIYRSKTGCIVLNNSLYCDFNYCYMANNICLTFLCSIYNLIFHVKALHDRHLSMLESNKKHQLFRIPCIEHRKKCLEGIESAWATLKEVMCNEILIIFLTANLVYAADV